MDAIAIDGGEIAASHARAGGRLQGKIYLAGGQETMTDAAATANFWSLDVTEVDNVGKFKWRQHPPWPGPPRVLPVTAAQIDGEGRLFHFLAAETPPRECKVRI